MSALDASELAPIQEETPPVEETPPQQATTEQLPEDPDPTEGLQEAAEQVAALKNALTAARGQLRELKPQAQQVQQLQQRLSQIEPLVPFAEFVKNNPHLLQQQPPPAPAPPPDPHTDPQLVAYAKRFDLYTADGKPDVERAKAIIDDNRSIAREEAQRLMEPVQHATHEQRAIANLNGVLAIKDGSGEPLRQEFITQAVQSIAQGVDQKELIRLLADPKVAHVVGLTALGLQAAAPKPKKVEAPTAPPLHVETAGGGSPNYQLTASGKRMAQLAKIPEKTYVETAKGFNPNGPNTFE